MGKAMRMVGVAGVILALCSAGAMAALDRTYYSGPGWSTLNINANNYRGLAQEATQGGPNLIVHGARADGSGVYQIISTNWGSTWTENFISATNYKELATMHGIANQFYAARADGTGLDRVYYSAGSWATLPVIGNDYKALAADPGQAGPTLMVYGARADGTGVDRIRSNNWGSTWYVDFPLLTTTDYKELESVTGVGNRCFGARADGTGLERVYYSGGWQTQSVVGGDYKGLAVDPGQAGPTFLLYGARADGSGVDRIRSNTWGTSGSWYLELPLLTTNNYDELCTMTGVTNQFYGSQIPEPVTLVLLAVGGLAALRRRHA